MAKIRKKSRKQILDQAKRLMKGQSQSRRERIQEIQSRYISNMERNDGVAWRMARNEQLNGMLNGTVPRQTYSEAKTNKAWGSVKDEPMSDSSIRGLKGMNNHFINNHPFSRNEYMFGKVYKGSSVG